MLVEFHQHATGLHDVHDAVWSVSRPKPVAEDGYRARTAPSIPPTAALSEDYGTVAARATIVVAVCSGELHAVSPKSWVGRSHQGVAGVSAVPGHRQSVLTSLITDGERRVFSRVPQPRSTLDLVYTYANNEIRCKCWRKIISHIV